MEDIKRIAGIEEIYLFDRVTSTNTIARKLIPRKRSALILAQEQTRGRGRFERRWYSPKGGLWFSLLLFPKRDIEPQLFTLLSSLALSQSLEELTHLPSYIRWPNDVLLDGKKVAGILCERIKGAMIIGIGINVNQEKFPPSLPSATSLKKETGKEYNPEHILKRFFSYFKYYEENLQSQRFSSLKEKIKEKSSLLLRFVTVDTGDKKLTGTVMDIDNQGRLVLRLDSGKELYLSSGEVKEVEWSSA